MSRKTPHDFALWTEVAKSVKPLRQKPGQKKTAAIPPAADIVRAVARISAPHIHVPRSTPAHPPPIASFDRRTSQKMTRGNVEIDRRIDLHGVGVELARVQLLQFFQQCHAERLRTVLVITGKGDSPFARHTLHGAQHFHAPERQGRLRRLMPEWLNEHDFRMLVSGFQPAHPKHGGGGAFYVKIRRHREDT